MMLRHIGEPAAADTIEDAVLVTLEEGKAVTQDLARQTGGDVEHAASTTGFTDSIIANLGKQPDDRPRAGRRRSAPSGAATPAPALVVRRRGVRRRPAHHGGSRRLPRDVGVGGRRPGPALEALAGDALRAPDDLQPRHDGLAEHRAQAGLVGLLRCRYVARADGAAASDADIAALVLRVGERFAWTHLEKLHVFAGEDGFTKAQGQ